MILGQTVLIKVVAGQPSEPLSILSVDRGEDNKETPKSKNLKRERHINNKDPYKNREPEVGGLSYPVIFNPSRMWNSVDQCTK